jgi:hypothetical protein
MELRDRFRGSLLGLAVGDESALGSARSTVGKERSILSCLSFWALALLWLILGAFLLLTPLGTIIPGLQ